MNYWEIEDHIARGKQLRAQAISRTLHRAWTRITAGTRRLLTLIAVRSPDAARKLTRAPTASCVD